MVAFIEGFHCIINGFKSISRAQFSRVERNPRKPRNFENKALYGVTEPTVTIVSVYKPLHYGACCPWNHDIIISSDMMVHIQLIVPRSSYRIPKVRGPGVSATVSSTQ